MSDPIESRAVLADRYRLGDVLGRSLMSEVYRGEDLRLERPVAIKLLRSDGDPSSSARFEREAQILARLHHPNIVVVFDTGIDGGDRFIVMELIEGPTLRQLIDEGGVGFGRAAEIASRIASALGSAHAHGIVHRDVKPSNVLLPPDGGVKLVDMGIARLLTAQALTLTMTALGTARYMSPEQARGDRLDGRSDVYSLGCVLFEMLSGRTPFDGDPIALSYAHIRTPAPRVRSITRDVPSAIDDLVASMLEKDPADRPQTAEDVQRSLAATTRDAVTQIEPTVPTEGVRLPSPPAPRAPLVERPTARLAPRLPLVIPLGGVLVLMVLLALFAAARPEDRTSASGPTPRASRSVERQEPTPASTRSPAPDRLSPEQAAAVVLDAVEAGVEADEISHDLAKEIDHTIDEILREIAKGEDVGKSLDKFDEFREKVSEAVDKGEITSPARASAINEALREFERAATSGAPSRS